MSEQQSNTTSDQEARGEQTTLTQYYLYQARQAFREQCYHRTPRLGDLFNEIVTLARRMSASLPPEQVFALLQEHPEWISAKMGAPENSIAGLVADQFASMIRRDLNMCWLTILLEPTGQERKESEQQL